MRLNPIEGELLMTTQTQDLLVQEVARIADCHRNTVLRYEQRGFITASRDLNGFRRYSLEEALKLKELLERRVEG